MYVIDRRILSMMQPQTRPRAYYSGEKLQPRRRDIFLHAGKTFRLIGGVITDRRVPFWGKLLFSRSFGGVFLLFFFPDLFSEAIFSIVLPLLGTVAGVPIDAGFASI